MEKGQNQTRNKGDREQWLIRQCYSSNKHLFKPAITDFLSTWGLQEQHVNTTLTHHQLDLVKLVAKSYVFPQTPT